MALLHTPLRELRHRDCTHRYIGIACLRQYSCSFYKILDYLDTSNGVFRRCIRIVDSRHCTWSHTDLYKQVEDCSGWSTCGPVDTLLYKFYFSISRASHRLLAPLTQQSRLTSTPKMLHSIWKPSSCCTSID